MVAYLRDGFALKGDRNIWFSGWNKVFGREIVLYAVLITEWRHSTDKYKGEL